MTLLKWQDGKMVKIWQGSLDPDDMSKIVATASKIEYYAFLAGFPSMCVALHGPESAFAQHE